MNGGGALVVSKSAYTRYPAPGDSQRSVTPRGIAST